MKSLTQISGFFMMTFFYFLHQQRMESFPAIQVPFTKKIYLFWLHAQSSLFKYNHSVALNF